MSSCELCRDVCRAAPAAGVSNGACSRQTCSAAKPRKWRQPLWELAWLSEAASGAQEAGWRRQHACHAPSWEQAPDQCLWGLGCSPSAQHLSLCQPSMAELRPAAQHTQVLYTRQPRLRRQLLNTRRLESVQAREVTPGGFSSSRRTSTCVVCAPCLAYALATTQASAPSAALHKQAWGEL